MSLERALALVDELYLQVKEIHREWEETTAKFYKPMRKDHGDHDDNRETSRFSPSKR